MVYRILIVSMLLRAKATSLNLPYRWDPISQTFRINQEINDTPPVVYVMPESHQLGGPLNGPASDCCFTQCGKTSQVDSCRNCCCCCNDDLIVIDTDCDADDAMALAMILRGAQHAPGISVAGITCTWGSTGIHGVAVNVMKTLKACNMFGEVPVYAGSDYGLVEAKNIPNQYLDEHGKDAFGDFLCFLDVEGESICAEHPAVYLARIVKENPGKVTLVCTGPLCNIAIAAHLYSNFYQDVKKIIYLGGNVNGTGKYDGASWNDHLDAFASMAVINNAPVDSNGPKICLFPDNCLQDHQLSWEWRDNELGKINTKIVNLMNFAESKKPRKESTWNYVPCIASAAAIEPQVVTEQVVGRCTVSPTGEMEIIIDHEHSNVCVIRNVNEAKVKEMATRYLA